VWDIESYNSSNFSDGWHLITLTNDGTTQKYYRDGALIGQQTNTITNSGSAAVLYVGMGGSTISSFFTGTIDGVRLYSASIPTSEIHDYYYSGLNRLLAKGEISKEEYSQKIRQLSINN
jgi:hypothetical protein